MQDPANQRNSPYSFPAVPSLTSKKVKDGVVSLFAYCVIWPRDTGEEAAEEMRISCLSWFHLAGRGCGSCVLCGASPPNTSWKWQDLIRTSMCQTSNYLWFCAEETREEEVLLHQARTWRSSNEAEDGEELLVSPFLAVWDRPTPSGHTKKIHKHMRFHSVEVIPPEGPGGTSYLALPVSADLL